MTFRNSALAALSGILLAAAFPTFNIHLLSWVALIPLFLALSRRTGKDAHPPRDLKTAGGAKRENETGIMPGFWLGGIAGLVYFTGTVHWVTNSVHFYGGIPVIPASLITLLLCAYLALYPALFGAAAVVLRNKRPSLFFLAAPALWTALELARTFVFSGFPWSLLGYTQYRALPVIQLADITGVYGVSFLIVLVNVSIAEFIRDRRNYRGVIAAVAVMGLALGYGSVRLQTQDNISGLTVSVVQGNIEQDKKWDRAYQAETSAVYKKLTREALRQHPDLVIWPETATPFYFTGDRPDDQFMTSDLISFVKEGGTALLFGSPTYEIQPTRRIIGRNSAFLVSADGRVDASYHKIHLVPFGEYVPLKRVLFFLDKMVQAIGDFQAGGEYTVMTLPYGRSTTRLSTVICYEIIFPDLVRRFVDQGANVITTITNDAWFGRTAAPYQHFSMAVFRAVENRAPVVRAANTGISGFIDAKGNILAATDIFTEAHLTHRVTPNGSKTFYTRHGDLFSYACLLISLALLAIPAKQVRTR